MAGGTFGGHQQREYRHRGRSELRVECILIGWNITYNRRHSAGHPGISTSAPAAARTVLLRRSAMLAEERLSALLGTLVERVYVVSARPIRASSRAMSWSSGSRCT